ncbi:MAG TPA: hypothetical protein VK550_06535 [Polyangiaceae bacterium]|nr:hypothetical protein [Polyangiaceae bacterium]
MDRTPRVPEYSLAGPLLLLLVMLGGSCTPKETAPDGGNRIGMIIRDSGAARELKPEVIVDAGDDIGERSEWTVEDVDEKLDQIFTEKIPSTAADRAVVTFVDEWMP